MKAQRGSRKKIYSFFNVGDKWGEWPTLRLGHFFPGKRSGIHRTGGWVKPRASLDGCKKSRSHSDSITGPPSP